MVKMAVVVVKGSMNVAFLEEGDIISGKCGLMYCV